MQRTWLKQQGERDLVLYMLGWASSPNAVLHIDPPGCDVLAVYNYTALEPLRAEDFAAYRRIYLFAWSFGVWVAEQCCRELPLYKAVALNGTPFPTDERYGMRLRVALRAMQGIVRGGLNSQAMGSRSMPSGPYPDRSPQEKLAELERLAAWSRADSAAHLTWHAAFIGNQDEMFPPPKMWAYWQSVGLGTGFAGSHYPFAQPSIVLDRLDA